METPKHHSSLTLRLAQLYPDEPSIRRILAWAEIDATLVAFSPIAINTWHSAITIAHHQHRLAQLVSVALEEFPTDPWLIAWHNLLTRTTHTQE